MWSICNRNYGIHRTLNNECDVNNALKMNNLSSDFSEAVYDINMYAYILYYALLRRLTFFYFDFNTTVRIIFFIHNFLMINHSWYIFNFYFYLYNIEYKFKILIFLIGRDAKSSKLVYFLTSYY